MNHEIHRKNTQVDLYQTLWFLPNFTNRHKVDCHFICCCLLNPGTTVGKEVLIQIC